MDAKTILTKAIQKAIDGGWDTLLAKKVKSIVDEEPRLITQASNNIYHLSPDNFIFNHDFAKALWGEPKVMSYKELRDAGYSGTGGVIDMRYPGWRYHIREMVVDDDPIKYLGEHLPE